MLSELNMNVEIGYPMTRQECEDIMRQYGVEWEDYENEEDCFCEMAERALSVGYGATARPC